jgi:hypothetical protein
MKTSLRQLAKQIGVSSSYLSQVNTGKRPPSARLLSNPDIRRLLSAKQNAKHEIDVDTRIPASGRIRTDDRRFTKPLLYP